LIVRSFHFGISLCFLLSSTMNRVYSPAQKYLLPFLNAARLFAAASSSENVFSGIDFNLPNKSAFFNPTDGNHYSYCSFQSLIHRLGSWLIKDMQVDVGDRVCAQVPKSVFALALCYASMKIGAIYVPISTVQPNSVVKYLLEDARPKLLLVDDNHSRETVVDVRGKQFANLINVVGQRQAQLQSSHHSADPYVLAVDSNHVAALCYTSGTTGRPKGAMITHGNLTSNAKTLAKMWCMNADDRLVHALPIYHVHGLFISLNACLFAGGEAILLDHYDCDQVAKAIPTANVFMGVPTYFTRLAKRGYCRADLWKRMRLLVSGSAPLTEATWQEYAHKAGHEILERYGMTEGQVICSNPYHGPRKPGTVGMALPGVEISIRQGVLHYRGENVCKGYWHDEEKTRTAFSEDGFFNSGDLASIDSDGYVTILGRSSDLIISGGFNVYPKEIELLLDSISGVEESAVVGVPHEDLGEAVIAVLVIDHCHKPITEQQIKQHLKAYLANYKIPKRIIFVDQLPRNAMSKLLRDKRAASEKSNN
ncbi:Acyl-CoA synthetase family member 3, mitochondrial, partial [Trichinella sp. T9]